MKDNCVRIKLYDDSLPAHPCDIEDNALGVQCAIENMHTYKKIVVEIKRDILESRPPTLELILQALRNYSDDDCYPNIMFQFSSKDNNKRGKPLREFLIAEFRLDPYINKMFNFIQTVKPEQDKSFGTIGNVEYVRDRNEYNEYIYFTFSPLEYYEQQIPDCFFDYVPWDPENPKINDIGRITTYNHKEAYLRWRTLYKDDPLVRLMPPTLR